MLPDYRLLKHVDCRGTCARERVCSNNAFSPPVRIVIIIIIVLYTLGDVFIFYFSKRLWKTDYRRGEPFAPNRSSSARGFKCYFIFFRSYKRRERTAFYPRPPSRCSLVNRHVPFLFYSNSTRVREPKPRACESLRRRKQRV